MSSPTSRVDPGPNLMLEASIVKMLSLAMNYFYEKWAGFPRVGASDAQL
jgi:hypothetical protein